MLRYYVLDEENHPVRVRDVIAWAQQFENLSNRIVAWTQVTSEITVSTVFLGLDHRHFGKGPPILFETMVFGGPLDEACVRYASWDDAQTGHAVSVRKVREAIGQKVKTDETC